MKITVKSKGHSFSILLPNILVVNSQVLNSNSKLSRKYIQKHAEEASEQPFPFSLSKKAARRARKIIRKTRRKHPDWYLVDVRSSDGEIVRIKL